MVEIEVLQEVDKFFQKFIGTMSDTDYRTFLLDFFNNPVGDSKSDSLIEKGTIERLIQNGRLQYIRISEYRAIEWNTTGLIYIPEHGDTEKIISNFQLFLVVKAFKGFE